MAYLAVARIRHVLAVEVANSTRVIARVRDASADVGFVGSTATILAAARRGERPAVLSALAVAEDIEAGRLVQVRTEKVDLSRAAGGVAGRQAARAAGPSAAQHGRIISASYEFIARLGLVGRTAGRVYSSAPAGGTNIVPMAGRSMTSSC
jgi:DNA-binding transcriptional LysR family regulator